MQEWITVGAIVILDVVVIYLVWFNMQLTKRLKLIGRIVPTLIDVAICISSSKINERMDRIEKRVDQMSKNETVEL